MDALDDTPPDTPPPSATDDGAQPLDALIASIRAAVAPGAAPEARAIGATACRAVLAALETQPGQPLASTPAPAASAIASSPIGALLASLAAMPRDQLIDTLLSRLRAALPPGTRLPISGAPRFHLIQLPQVARPAGGA